MTHQLTPELLEKLESTNFSEVVSRSAWEARLSYGDWYFQHYLRTRHIGECGFPILTKEVLDLLVPYLLGKKVVDVGCGTGYLASILHNAGVRIDAVDNRSTQYSMGTLVARHFSVTETDVKELDLSLYDVVIMSWPDYNNDFAVTVCENMKVGQVLPYQGEHKYGCCADEAFFDLLDSEFKEYDHVYGRLNSGHCTFGGIHDRWHVFKKTVKLPGN
jgi:hypothetical protein